GHLHRIRRVVDADAVAARAAEQAVDRHAPQLAGYVPQRLVDAGEGVGHERPAANVAVGAVDLLPQVLDPRRVLAVEQLVQRLGQGLRDARIDALDVAPAGDAVVRLDLDEDAGVGPVGAQAGDADARRAVGDLRRGAALAADGLDQVLVGVHERPTPASSSRSRR